MAPAVTDALDPWPACGWRDLQTTPEGGLQTTAAWWLRWLQRPELTPPEDACAAERGLVHRLHRDPLRPVAAHELEAIADADARENWQHWLRFRDELQAAGTVQAWYLKLMRHGDIQVPPLFLDLVVQVMLRQMLDGVDDAFEWRAAEMLFRTQRVALQDGAVLAGDQETVDMLNETGGFGELGRLLTQAQARLRTVQMRVLSPDNAREHLLAACAEPPRFDSLLDLRHETTRDLGHGVQFKLARAQSGLKGLSRVLERWVAHLLGVKVHIEPVSQVTDARWRWHIGLDVEATALLNDLYAGEAVPEQRLRHLISLFRLRFDNPAEMRADLRQREGGNASERSTPIYLGLAMRADGRLRVKPQNLVLNLPLAQA
jgi:Family of unknown function (DUF6352)